jgi:general secretion pathway protein G
MRSGSPLQAPRASLAVFALASSLGCLAQPKYSYMSARDVFPDERVARMAEAASRGNAAGVDTQIRAGADVNFTGADDISPLLWVITEGNRISSLRLENIDLLLKHGADINYHRSSRDSAADLAATLGRFDLVVHLLEKGFDSNLTRLAKIVDITRVPADSDAQRWKKRAIEILIEPGPDIRLRRTVNATLRSICAAAKLFRLDVGRFPNESEGLVVMLPQAGGFQASKRLKPSGYLESMPLDPWGRPYVYIATVTGYQVITYGADGIPGGAGLNEDVLCPLLNR